MSVMVSACKERERERERERESDRERYKNELVHEEVQCWNCVVSQTTPSAERGRF